MALLFDLVTRANTDDDAEAAAAAFRICDAVGLELRTTASAIGGDATELAQRRDIARDNKDWKLADSLRDQLIELGYEVEDTPTGTRLRRR
jgi:cysteinyl-tRNA synthetase